MGHKTNGGWDDVTSIGRNEVVFEGRHKAYGAFYIRKRYNFVLLIALLSTLSVGVVVVGIPILVRLFSSVPVLQPVIETNVDHHIIDIPAPPPRPAVKPPAPKPPALKPPTTANVPPVVTSNPTVVDSDKTMRQKQELNMGTVTIAGPPEPPAPPTPPAPPGPPAPPAPPVLRADVMPKFPGDMNEFIINHVQFPQYLRDLGVDGIVYVNFIVETDGSVSNVKILRGIAGADQLSTETVNAVNIMPKWSPGMQGGHPVRVQYMLPVHFKVL